MIIHKVFGEFLGCWWTSLTSFVGRCFEMNHFPKNRHQKTRYDNPRLKSHVHVELLEKRQVLSITGIVDSGDHALDQQAQDASDQMAVTRSVSHSSIRARPPGVATV